MKYVLALIGICLLLTLIWFQKGEIIGGGDAGLNFYSPSISVNLSKTAWVEYATGAPTLGWLPNANALYFFSILEKVGIPNFILQGSSFFLIMSLGTVSFYLLCFFFLNGEKKSRLIAFVGALFYLFNPFSMSQVWARGQPAQQVGFGLLPLATLIFILGVKKKSFLYALLTVAILTIFSSAFGYLTFIVVFWFSAFVFVSFVIGLSREKKKEAICAAVFFLGTFFLWIGVNSWWLMPLFLSSGSAYTSALSEGSNNIDAFIGISKSFTPDITLRLLQKAYFFTPSILYSIDSSFILQAISFIPFIFLVIGFLKVIKDKNLINFRIFAVILILGLVVSLGANPPLGWLFVELLKHVPVLQAFRNPYEKFGLVYSLGYSAIFALGLIVFSDNKRYKSFIIITILILTCGIFAWPMWTGRVIAGPDKKIGIVVPQYYKDLRDWLKNKVGDSRVFMTPLWSGDGAFYAWPGGGRFQGSDPMIYILDAPIISSSLKGPFYYEFMEGIRKYASQINVAPSLQLLRIEYLVNRKDAIFITDFEKEHAKLLTEAIYPPLGYDLGIRRVCNNLQAGNTIGERAWIACKLSPLESNWAGVRYLQFKIKSNVNTFLHIAIVDKNGVSPTWFGKMDDDYSIDNDGWKLITVPLGNPTEYNYATDFSHISGIDIQAYPKDQAENSVVKLELEGISLDPGKEEKINDFHLVTSFGKLDVYGPNKFNPPPEFGILSQLSLIDNFHQLFIEVEKHKNDLDKLSFILKSQNRDKNLQELNKEVLSQVEDKTRISNTRYWIKVKGKGQGFILLSKTFNTQWKVIPGVKKDELSGTIIGDFNLLKQVALPEDNHFVVNGYANLWKIDSRDSEFALVYIPQVIVDIGFKLSRIFAVSLLVIFSLLLLKQYTKKHFLS